MKLEHLDHPLSNPINVGNIINFHLKIQMKRIDDLLQAEAEKKLKRDTKRVKARKDRESGKTETKMLPRKRKTGRKKHIKLTKEEILTLMKEIKEGKVEGFK